ncbi:MAG: haloacid dehalogenase-like hydrolase [Verrucomicrobiae bacterium]|nr:haloacid dehalogenase-like hydrolase [Verrucomicrobiae bacterium]
MRPILMLWDIDGTLLSCRTGVASLQRALLNGFGVLDDLSRMDLAGRPDTAIAEEIAARHPGHGIDPWELLENYLVELEAMLPSREGIVFPGVREILNWSHEHPEVHNALLTGNIERGAYLKLKRFDLDRFFEFGAFGDDSSDRNRLGPVALDRARARLKKDFALERTWVIGDTPRDIACARALGCKALAVATGSHPVESLMEADLALRDLSDHCAVIRAIERSAEEEALAT